MKKTISFPNGQSGTRLLQQYTGGTLSVVVLTVVEADYLELSGLAQIIQLLDELFGTFEFIALSLES